MGRLSNFSALHKPNISVWISKTWSLDAENRQSAGICFFFSLLCSHWLWEGRSTMQPANWLVFPRPTYPSESSQLWRERHTSQHMMLCTDKSRWPAFVKINLTPGALVDKSSHRQSCMWFGHWNSLIKVQERLWPWLNDFRVNTFGSQVCAGMQKMSPAVIKPRK